MCEHMIWYKKLTVDQRIALKSCFVLVCGVRWEDLSSLFSMRERIEIVYNKLKIEGLL